MAKFDSRSPGLTRNLGQFNLVASNTEKVFSPVDTVNFLACTFVVSHTQLDTVGIIPWDIVLEDSDDGINFSIVNSENIIGDLELPVSGAPHIANTWKLGYIGKRRYVRLKFMNPNGATVIDSISCTAFLNASTSSPTSALTAQSQQ